jgi:hypothetical protein
VLESGVSDNAAGDGLQDSCADGIGARDGATGSGLFDFAVKLAR